MKKILVIGGTGLIGALLSESLARKNQIFVMSKSPPKKNIQNISWIPCDLEQSVNFNTIAEDFDQIVYLAQSIHFREFPAKAINIFNVNTFQFLQVLDYAYKKGIKKVVYASSGGVYGHCSHPFTEDDIVSPKSELGFYQGTKLCSEMLASTYRDLLDVPILRFFFVYGPGQRQSMLIPRLVNNVIKGIPITLEGENGIFINPTYVADAVKAVELVLECEGSPLLNVGGSEVLSIKQICEIIGGVVNKKPIFEQRSTVSGSDIIGNINKLKSYGWAPEVSFKDGIIQVTKDLV